MTRFIAAISLLLLASAANGQDFFGVKIDVLEKQGQKLEEVYNNTARSNELLEGIDGNVKTLLDRVQPPAPSASDLVIDLDVPQASLPPAVTASVVKIRAVGDCYNPETRKIDRGVKAIGSAVADSENTFRTVAHLAEGMRGAFAVEVELNGEWKACSYQSTPRVDHAVATLPRHGVPPVKTRAPHYLETVWVYGMRTKAMKKGAYTSDGIVSLDKWINRTDQGDSGGGVFSADGHLVGTLRGYQKRVESAVTFTEVGEESEVVAVAPAAKTPASPAPAQNCPDGKCPLQQAPATQPGFRLFGGRRR
jgi:hypothetical protein